MIVFLKLGLLRLVTEEIQVITLPVAYLMQLFILYIDAGEFNDFDNMMTLPISTSHPVHPKGIRTVTEIYYVRLAMRSCLKPYHKMCMLTL